MTGLTHWDGCGMYHPGCLQSTSAPKLIELLDEAVNEVESATISASHELAEDGARRQLARARKDYEMVRDEIARRLGT